MNMARCEVERISQDLVWKQALPLFNCLPSVPYRYMVVPLVSLGTGV